MLQTKASSVLAHAARALRGRSAVERDLGEFVLARATAYSATIAGDPTAFNRPALLSVLSDKPFLSRASEALQFLQTALQPRYTENLFDFYREQQFNILLNFLSYPFRGSLDSYVRPYDEALSGPDPLDILDYGAGMPYGLIHIARTAPNRIRSATLVDLDLVHTRLAEFILEGLLPGRVRYARTRDANAIPELSGPFNVLYGKDIFEHLTNPRAHLEAILPCVADTAVCFLDLNDHGEAYLQHVSPELAPLRKLVTDCGFKYVGEVSRMSKFERSA